MMINRRLFLAGSASTAALVALAACSSSDSSSGGDSDLSGLPGSDINPQERDALEDGGELKLPVNEIIAQFNPMHIDGNTHDNASVLQQFISVSNYIYADDASFTANTDYCTEFTQEEVDGKTVVTLTLNPEAKWNSGDPITYEDYVATWKAGNESDDEFTAVVASTDGWVHIESIEKGADEFQVIITFDEIFPDWGSITGGPYSAALCKDVDTFANAWKDGNVTEFSTGPFIVTNFDKTSGEITLERNDNWWGEPAKLDKVTLRVISGGQEGTAFANKEIDVLSGIIDAATYEQCEARTDGEIRQATGLQWRHFTINATTGVLADQDLRHAIVKGIDRVTMTTADLQGLPVPSEQLQLGNHIFMPAQEGYQDNTGDLAYDAEAAMADLEELGWVVPEGSEDGIREKDGEKLSIKYLRLPDVSTSATEGKILQDNMAAIGVEIKMDDTDPNDFFTRISGGEFEIVTFTWVGTPYAMANIGQIYGKDSASNYTGVYSDELEELITEIATEGDDATRREMANQADELIWDLAAVIPIYSRADYTAVPANLANYGAFGMSTVKVEDIGYLPASETEETEDSE